MAPVVFFISTLKLLSCSWTNFLAVVSISSITPSTSRRAATSIRMSSLFASGSDWVTR